MQLEVSPGLKRSGDNKTPQSVRIRKAVENTYWALVMDQVLF